MTDDTLAPGAEVPEVPAGGSPDPDPRHTTQDPPVATDMSPDPKEGKSNTAPTIPPPPPAPPAVTDPPAPPTANPETVTPEPEPEVPGFSVDGITIGAAQSRRAAALEADPSLAFQRTILYSPRASYTAMDTPRGSQQAQARRERGDFEPRNHSITTQDRRGLRPIKRA